MVISEIVTESKNSEDQKSTLKNIETLYKSRGKVIELFNYYSGIVSESKHKAKYGERLEILSPKQMPQRLPIALAHIKADNTSKNLLNKIRQKTITKKVYNNIMNSINLDGYYIYDFWE